MVASSTTRRFAAFFDDDVLAIAFGKLTLGLRFALCYSRFERGCVYFWSEIDRKADRVLVRTKHRARLAF
jgi:hypothetical protein